MSSAAQAAEPKAQVQGELDGSLKAEIQQAVGETERPIQNRFEARRRARDAAESAIAVLRSEGYYAYVVEPDVSEADPPKPFIRIMPGPRFVFGEPTLRWQGTPPDNAAQGGAVGAIALKPGDPGRAADVIAAEGRIVALLQGRGYADAQAQPRDVVVDHADDTVTPNYLIAAGPLVKLDGIELTSTRNRTNPAWVRRLAPWTSGDVYKPDDVAELERRLLDTGVYDTVTVALAPADKTGPDGLRPVFVGLSERKRRTIEAGASYSTVDGVGLDARWTHYNVFHRADTMALYGRLATQDSRVGVDVSLPHWRQPQQTLRLGAAVYRQRTDAYDATGVGAHADVTRRYGKTSYVTVGASVDASRNEELQPENLSPLGRDLITVAALGDVLLDRSNDPLDPRQGWRLSARVEPTFLLGHNTNLPYVRVVVQGTGYLPIEKSQRTVLAGRLRVGRILNGSIPAVPASQRFYAGGGGSVRGFAYQAVGDRLADGTPRGGLSLFEASAEVRHDLSRTWGVAAFVDTGAIGSTGPVDFKNLAVGAGVGVRYTVGVIPIRVDIATPVANGKDQGAFQIYISIGQSF
jgi:translocation and assembly module TamA